MELSEEAAAALANAKCVMLVSSPGTGIYEGEVAVVTEHFLLTEGDVSSAVIKTVLSSARLFGSAMDAELDKEEIERRANDSDESSKN